MILLNILILIALLHYTSVTRKQRCEFAVLKEAEFFHFQLADTNPGMEYVLHAFLATLLLLIYYFLSKNKTINYFIQYIWEKYIFL